MRARSWPPPTCSSYRLSPSGCCSSSSYSATIVDESFTWPSPRIQQRPGPPSSFETPFQNEAPRYLLHDRDKIFAEVATTIASMNIQAVRTAPRSPWQNAYVERVIGSIRRECLDHVIALSAAGHTGRS